MTLDEAIKHAEEVANEKENLAKTYETFKDFGNHKSSITSGHEKCLMCAEEHRQLAEWLKELKQLREQEPCDDAISRQAVEEITWEEPSYTDALNVLAEMRDKVRALPSVTPQPKMGQWIRIDKDKLKCSECEVIHYIAQYPQSANINYCPNCGTKMEEEEC